jgi:hypothetical protein
MVQNSDANWTYQVLNWLVIHHAQGLLLEDEEE